MHPFDGLPALARFLVVLAVVAIVVTFLRAASDFVGPILLALFIAIVATAPMRWMRRRGVPKWGALAIIIFVLVDVGSLLAVVSTGALEGFKDSLPGYQERFRVLNDEFGNWLEDIGIADSREAVPDMFNAATASRFLRSALSSVSGTLTIGLFIILLAVVMIIEAPGMPAKLKQAFNLSRETEARLWQVIADINRYMLIKSLSSLGTAICVGLLLWALGVDYEVFWAIFAFFLNFVPYVGAVLMMIPPVLMALVQIDVETALLVAIGYVTINSIGGSIVEPRLMGRSLGMSTLAVFLSIMFWGWVLGSVGVFLSIPLTMALIVALDARPETRPLAILLGPEMKRKRESLGDNHPTA